MKIATVLYVLALGGAFAYPEERIANGQDAEPYSAPYIVSLRDNSTSYHKCGGTIINKEWILTAAHCVNKNAVGMEVIAGLYKIHILDDSVQQRTIDFGKTHKLKSTGRSPYDIALLHVKSPFKFNKDVQPAILPARGESHEGSVKVYGWGKYSGFPLLTYTLKTATVEIMDLEECKKYATEKYNVADSNICTSPTNGVTTCEGDSGGPLVKHNENSPAELVGIVSWGYPPCDYSTSPSIFIRVSAYIDWISEVMSAYYTIF